MTSLTLFQHHAINNSNAVLIDYNCRFRQFASKLINILLELAALISFIPKTIEIIANIKAAAPKITAVIIKIPLSNIFAVKTSTMYSTIVATMPIIEPMKNHGLKNEIIAKIIVITEKIILNYHAISCAKNRT